MEAALDMRYVARRRKSEAMPTFAAVLRKLHLLKPEPGPEELFARVASLAIKKARSMDMASAIELMKKAISFAPDLPEAHVLKGMMLLDMKDYCAAGAAFNAAVALGERQDTYHSRFSYCDIISKYISMRYDSPCPHTKSTAYVCAGDALCHINIGYPDNARKDFEYAINLATSGSI
jgi:tetratricopeptide (TPR) repeat protein